MKRAIIATLLIFCACSSQSPSKKTEQSLRINLGVEPSSLDPRKARDLPSLTVVRELFDGLMRIGKDEKPELALADSYTLSDDLKTYTFHLRKAKWTNGDPVTAADFVYSWKSSLNPDFRTDNAYQLYLIKNAKQVKKGELPLDAVGVRALDSQTVQIELENPTPYFLELLAYPIFFPINERVEKKLTNWSEKSATYVSNGPFALKEWAHSNALVLTKNKNYWDESAVHLNELRMTMVNEETALKMFEKGELDWAGSPLSKLPLDALSHLKEKNQLKAKSLLGTCFFRVNTEKSPYTSLHFRKALALAVHREEILKHVTNGTQLPATGLVPQAMGLQETPYFKDGDAAAARSALDIALKELHLTKETLPKITYSYNMGERNHLIAQAMQQQWREVLGIHVQLEAVEPKILYQKVSRQDYEMAEGSWTADFNDPVNFLEVFKFKKASTNNTHWENAEYTELLNLSSSTRDANERFSILKKGEHLIMDAMPIVPIFHYTMLYVKNEKIKGEVLSGMGNIDFKWASFDE